MVSEILDRLRHLLLIGAIFHFGMAMFHLAFAKVFRWNDELPRLGFINRQLLPVMNLCLTLIFLEVSYLSWAYSEELLLTELGHAVLLSIGFFWLFRALLQIWFFRLRHWLSWLLLVLFLGASVIYIGSAQSVFIHPVV